ncbi:virulence factor Mce family protein [Amycolatopsis arida]|uniref:Virulence factor Mce family protein n=1 Tax=Amycolatopsis arida TaxID=587909 RepID=A0A1I5VBK9_9PSEU|nr:MCE family protein [Amycolatopsis arida]TDX91220.1 virulence factor Mce-like protein [Amycolatopsis arida]SFQ04893.1 virulence factor Mce family protein [Amycolatopsis arida]
MSARSALRSARYPLLGLVFLVVIASFLALTVAVYAKVFSRTVEVELETDRIGNQMRIGSEVKLRDVRVGEVSALRSDGRRAVLTLALNPEQVHRVPANVTARLLPKTLFGERFVSLEVPDRPAPVPLAAGAVIPQDRSANAVEIERVLDELMPVLRAVQPQKLAATLTAVATALEGRGASLGETVRLLDGYVRELVPALPDLTAVLADAAPVAEGYGRAGPDLLAALADLTATSRTLVARRDTLRELMVAGTTVALDAHAFLAANRDNVIGLVAAGRGPAEVLARYAPQYPCLLRQVADLVPKAEEFVGKGTDHPGIATFTAEITVNRGPYVPGVDTPRYGDRRGPRCYALSGPGEHPPAYPADGPFEDGSTKPAARQPQHGALPPGGGGAPEGAAGSLAHSPAERDLLGVLLSPRLGVPPPEVPGWSSLLVGPLYRGAEVVLR